MTVQISTTFIYQHKALVKFCQDLSQISDDFSVNQEGSKSQCLLLLAFLGLTLDIYREHTRYKYRRGTFSWRSIPWSSIIMQKFQLFN